MIGNTDNHIKNSSLIYGKDLSSIRLAPLYDVVCTKIYESSTDEMSVSINCKQNINQITKDDFEKEAKNCGLGSKVAMKFFEIPFSTQNQKQAFHREEKSRISDTFQAILRLQPT